MSGQFLMGSKSKANGVLGAVILFIWGCGVEVGNPRKPSETGTDETASQSVQTDIFSVAYEEFLASVETSSGEAQNSASLTLMAQNIEEGLTCTVFEETKLKTTFKGSNSYSDTNRINPRVSFSGSLDIESQSIWTPLEGELPLICSRNLAVLRLGNRTVLTRERSTTITRNFTRTRADGSSRSRESVSEFNGVTNWTVLAKDDETITLQRVIQSSVERSVNVVGGADIGGATINYSATTLENSPLTIESVWSNAGAWLQRTVKSGSYSTTRTNAQGGQATIELTFKDLEFERVEGCLAKSGEVSGVYSNGEESLNFTVDLLQNQVIFDGSEEPADIESSCLWR